MTLYCWKCGLVLVVKKTSTELEKIRQWKTVPSRVVSINHRAACERCHTRYVLTVAVEEAP